MKRITYLALSAAFLVFGFTSAWAAGAQPTDKPAANTSQPAVSTSPAVTLDLSWLSINGGGISYGSGGTRQIGYSVGQSVAGEGSGGTRKIGIGFWYSTACASAKGDMNGIGGYTSADAVSMLNCVYLGTGNCDLCFADVNCSGNLTGADAVLELNKVYLGINTPPWCGP